MVLEIAVLDVVAGREAEFEQTFPQAAPFLQSMQGYRSHRLERCIETPSRYVLLVEWDRIEDHTEGFRNSPEYQQWRALLHHFYDPPPQVAHYATVAG
jgi:heme-degrading monooxygenase HmoA